MRLPTGVLQGDPSHARCVGRSRNKGIDNIEELPCDYAGTNDVQWEMIQNQNGEFQLKTRAVDRCAQVRHGASCKFGNDDWLERNTTIVDNVDCQQNLYLTSCKDDDSHQLFQLREIHGSNQSTSDPSSGVHQYVIAGTGRHDGSVLEASGLIEESQINPPDGASPIVRDYSNVWMDNYHWESQLQQTFHFWCAEEQHSHKALKRMQNFAKMKRLSEEWEGINDAPPPPCRVHRYGWRRCPEKCSAFPFIP